MVAGRAVGLLAEAPTGKRLGRKSSEALASAKQQPLNISKIMMMVASFIQHTRTSENKHCENDG
jgi:hypothetical protein